jgi:autotransporter strand-loop-strand O-heptosyltransferase
METISVKVDYVTVLPSTGDRTLYSPKVTINGEGNEVYKVQFIDMDSNQLIFLGECRTNETIMGRRQWYTHWLIRVLDSVDNILYQNEFNPAGQTVFIKIDAFALGDNLAWMPYIEEFRKKHFCTVICSTFFNDLFEGAYPNLLFVKPNTKIGNVYAQYYIGASIEEDKIYCPIVSIDVPLQKVATEILGLEYKEIRPSLAFEETVRPVLGVKYVCISEFASGANKEWKEIDGWQGVVNYLVSKNYRVVVISKEPTNLTNVINRCGDIPLVDRIMYLEHAELFIGVSSGLSWLSWAVGTHVLMISDVTPSWHEFQNNITRLIKKEKEKVDYSPTECTSLSEVISALDKLGF